MPKKNDVTGDPIAVEFNGETYMVPPADQWDLDVLEAIDDQRMTHALKALIGDDQYALFRKGNRKVSDLGEFFTTAGKAADAGKS
jgi:hypothetical protein